ATRRPGRAGAPRRPAPGPGGPATPARSAAAEDDQPVRGIVGGDRDGPPIAGDDADVVAAHAAADLGEELHAVVALHAVVPAGERLDDGTFYLNEIIASQGRSW